jgi:hypothetical protein
LRIGQGLGVSFSHFIGASNISDSIVIPSAIHSPTLSSLRIEVQVLPFFTSIGSASFRRKLVEILPSKRVQAVKRITDVMKRSSMEVLQAKKRALTQGDEAALKHVGQGKDIMSVLCESFSPQPSLLKPNPPTDISSKSQRTCLRGRSSPV